MEVLLCFRKDRQVAALKTSKKRSLVDTEGDNAVDDFRCPSVTAFLAMLRNLHPDLEWKCLHGSCFRLYLLLKEVWPDAEAWTNVDHVITKIDGRFYDIRGEVASTGYALKGTSPPCIIGRIIGERRYRTG